jgi:hypothetical protein
METVTPLNPAQTSKQEQQVKGESYIMRVLIAADMAANVALGGEEDETISTDAGLMAKKHEFIGVLVSRMLDLFQRNHGAKAAAGDMERASAVQATIEGSGLVNAPSVTG